MKAVRQSLKQGFESVIVMIGDIIPVSIGLKNPAILLERMEQFIEKGSLQLEVYVEEKLQEKYQKETFIQEIKKQPILPPHSIRIQELDKGLSKDDVLKRLAEIDRMIITREQEQKRNTKNTVI